MEDAERELLVLETPPLEIVPNECDHVLDAERVKATYPLSYADAFAVAMAIRLETTAVTGDPEPAAVE